MWSLVKYVSLLIITSQTTVLAQDRDPRVQVSNGTIQGKRCPSTPVNSFLAIPYAKPPLDELRFMPAQPRSESFDGVLDATTPAVSCPQFNSEFAEYYKQTEDWYVFCLKIHVFRFPY